MTRAARVPIAGAILANLALIAALVHGPQSLGSWAGFSNTWWPVVLLLFLAFVLCATAIIRRANAMVSEGDGPLLMLPALFGGAVIAIWSSHVDNHSEYAQVDNHSEYVALPAFMGLAGWVLLTAAVARPVVGAIRSPTPWQTLAGGETSKDRAQSALLTAGPALTGAGLIAFASLLGAPTGPVGVVGDAFAGVGLGAALVALVLTAIAVRQMTAYRGPMVRRRPVAEASATEIAAHLHDSVLQQLATIRRQADDPSAVRDTARMAERELRAWLAGRSSTAGSLSSALAEMAADVEDEQPGSTVEVITVRDAALDERIEAMVQAAREAVRNAVHHGGGTAHVFAEVHDDDSIEAYVRDDGPGFDPQAVPNERRGVRDSIIGRMQDAGGSASIDSTSEGTEIALVLPPPESP